MNFKALAIASAIALGSVFGSTTPAEARVSACWVMKTEQQRTSPFRCDVSKRITSDGTIVFDIRHFQGNGAFFSVVMYTDNTALLYINGEKITTTVQTDRQGDHWLDLGSYGSFIFRT